MAADDRPGAMPSTTPISVSMCAALSPLCRSRTIARGTTAIGARDNACTSRAAISTYTLRDSAQATDAATNTASPNNSAGRRPWRSDSGPATSCANPHPYMYTDSVSWTSSGVAASACVIDGIDAR
jgi:hypothetical protein